MNKKSLISVLLAALLVTSGFSQAVLADVNYPSNQPSTPTLLTYGTRIKTAENSIELILLTLAKLFNVGNLNLTADSNGDGTVDTKDMLMQYFQSIFGPTAAGVPNWQDIDSIQSFLESFFALDQGGNFVNAAQINTALGTATNNLLSNYGSTAINNYITAYQPPATACGNGTLELGEVCDGETNVTQVCTVNGEAGTQQVNCNATCDGWTEVQACTEVKGSQWQENGTNLYYNGGNVGVGTSTPTVALDVNGQIKATGFRLGDSATAGSVLTTDANGVGTWQQAAPDYWTGDLTNITYPGTATAANLNSMGAVRFGLDHTGIIGENSLAAGRANQATGPETIALGNSVIAGPGEYAIAMGVNATASGDVSVAIGENMLATGYESWALGTLATVNGEQSWGINLDDSNPMTVNGYHTFGVNLNGANVFAQDNTFSIMGGNVGIGTTTPSAALDVNGVIKATGFDLTGDLAVGGGYTDADGQGVTIAANGDVQATGNIYLKGNLYRENLQELNVQNNTLNLNAGGSAQDAFIKVSNTPGQIKWDNANAKWDISNLISATGLTVTGSSSLGTASVSALNLGNASITGSALVAVNATGGVGFSSALYEVGGKVGIGTNVPAETVEISSGAGAASRLRVTDVDAAQNPEMQLQFGANANDHWGLYVDKAANNALKIWGGSDRLTVASNGNVGIGTTNPTSPLTVAYQSSRYSYCFTNGTSPSCGPLTDVVKCPCDTTSNTYFLDCPSGGFETTQITAAVCYDQLAGPPWAYFRRTTSERLGLAVDGVTGSVNLGGESSKALKVNRSTVPNIKGADLLVEAGGPTANYADQPGGNLQLSSGLSVGRMDSQIEFYTPTAQAVSQLVDNIPALRMVIKGNGNVGIGTSAPNDKLEIAGDIRIGKLPPLGNNPAATVGNYLRFSSGGTVSNGSVENTDPVWISRYDSGNDQSFLRVSVGDNISNDTSAAHDYFQIGGSPSGVFAPAFNLNVSTGNIVIGKGDGTASPASVLMSGPAGVGNNVTGANLTIAASNGTGTGGSGSIIFQTAKPSASGQVQIDSVATRSETYTPASWTHTVANQSNRLLLVGFNGTHSTDVFPLNSVNFVVGGTSYNLTRLVERKNGDVNYPSTASIWYLVNPPVGTGTINANAPAGINITATSISFYNVDISSWYSNVANNVGTSAASPSVAVASANGELVFGIVAYSNGGTPFATFSTAQTLHSNVGSGISGHAHATLSSLSAGSNVSLSGTFSSNKMWAAVGVSIKPAPNTTPNSLVNALTLLPSGDVTLLGNLTQEAWINITAPQNSWHSYYNSGTTTISPTYQIAYFKDKNNIVHLKGLIQGGNAANNTVLFTLPVGYRPGGTENRIFGPYNSANTTPRVDVNANGNVSLNTWNATTPPTAGGTHWISLDGISFRAEQ